MPSFDVKSVPGPQLDMTFPLSISSPHPPSKEGTFEFPLPLTHCVSSACPAIFIFSAEQALMRPSLTFCSSFSHGLSSEEKRPLSHIPSPFTLGIFSFLPPHRPIGWVLYDVDFSVVPLQDSSRSRKLFLSYIPSRRWLHVTILSVRLHQYSTVLPFCFGLCAAAEIGFFSTFPSAPQYCLSPSRSPFNLLSPLFTDFSLDSSPITNNR